MTHEDERLRLSRERRSHWKRWGPYLSERAWGTVREDYSPDGAAWDYLPHDHARSRAYRWGEDGIGGICDRHQLICFAISISDDRGHKRDGRSTAAGRVNFYASTQMIQPRADTE